MTENNKELPAIDEYEGWKLLEDKTINDRTLVCWYNPENEIISLCLFNIYQTNELSKRTAETTWGFITHAVSEMHTCDEAAEIVGLYLKDMESENYWWEID